MVKDFSEWYTEVVVNSGLVDYGPVKGTMAIMPYGYAIWEFIQKSFDEKIKRSGHKNAYFPMFIPESLLKKEEEHFQSFSAEAFWITEEGNRKISERLAVRPTSETIIYYFFSKWIRSWRDLPLLVNQWCNVARAEIKMTKPFLRTKEFLWQEGHTAHATKEEAEKEASMILGYYREVLEEELAIPVIAGRKSESEKFAGAVYTLSLEAMVRDGRAVQVATSHYLGQNFSKPFEVKFMDEKGDEEYAHTTSWGISTRLIGALVMVHGDEKGLVIPPRVAPIQVIIIPIYTNENKESILRYAEDLCAELNACGIRAELDKREDKTPGYKFNDYELKGVPIRAEIGEKEVGAGKVSLAIRHNGRKEEIKRENACISLKELLLGIQKEMYVKASEMLSRMTLHAKSYDELLGLSGKGFVIAGWCGSSECEAKIKNETTMTSRVVLEEKHGNCIVCGREARYKAYFAKSY
ncbi:MAG: proline--tRNA ligase [Candidatus Micrarchaeaceae archaeon]